MTNTNQELMNNNKKFPLQIVAGAALIFSGFIIGRFAQIIFFTQFDDPSIRLLAILLYLVSWMPTILGIWWVGREMALRLKNYLSPLFYTKKMRDHIQKKMKSRRRKREKTWEKHQLPNELLK